MSVGKNSRRGFLTTLIMGGAALYVGGWWCFKVRKGDASDHIKSVLRKRLGYLKLDKDGVDSFSREFQTRTSDKRRFWGSWIGIIAPVYALVDLVKILPKSRSFEEFEDDIITHYLLSSDFFDSETDTSRTIQYVQFYDTYEMGCANPFARF